MKTDELFNTDPFDLSEQNKRLFLESYSENFYHHLEHSNQFRSIMQARSIQDPSKLEDHYLMINLFKYKNLCSGPDEDIVLRLTSSGTGGQKSQQKLNQLSLDRVKKLAYNVYQSLGITSDIKSNYICFTYDPKVANDLGTAFTDELLTSFTPNDEVFYAFQWDEAQGDFVFKKEQVIEKLYEYAKTNTPTRILGFPAFLWQIIKETDIKINLGNDSWLLTGGGWKNHQDQQISKSEFRVLVEEHLGIPRENCRDLFGMVEHGVPYVDCKNGKFRIPNYSRVLVRDPETLDVLPYGDVGLLQFICSYNTSYPCLNVLSTDWGRVLKSDDDHPADILEIIGRAGISKHKGCALKALEIKEGK